MTESSLRDALVDVRKAGRLLHDFNQRMFDIARAIDESLDGYSFETIWNLYDPLSDWNPRETDVDYWETLPFSSTGFLWVRRAHDGKKETTDRLFGVQITADDNHLEDEIDDDVHKWPTPENGSSSISLWLARPAKEIVRFDAGKIYNEFYLDTPMTRVLSNRKSIYHVYNSFDLLAFTTKAQVRETVTDFMTSAESLLQMP